ncbi:hypothetical protein [Kitasatospora sp. NPDC088548]|uniref:hypothetical protein n=1 Tax=Kitasatospora sp. NPDC088548 TaxID=3364075 RepID=UPI0038152482
MSTVRVQGAFPDGQLYEVQVTGDPARPVVGSKLVAVMVERAGGELVRPHPTARAVPVDGADVRSVVALLQDRTEILELEGDLPAPERHVAGRVY